MASGLERLRRDRLACRHVGVVIALITGGCEYTTEALYPENIRTVSVPIFNNRTFYHGVEFDLTEAVVKEIEVRTPYKVTQVGMADSELRGTITKIEQDRMSRRRPGGLPQEMELSLSVNFEWNDLRENKVLRSRNGFMSSGIYVPTAALGETLEIAQHSAVERMAHEIVSVMQSDW